MEMVMFLSYNRDVNLAEEVHLKLDTNVRSESNTSFFCLARRN